jgi:hypothetical protein
MNLTFKPRKSFPVPSVPPVHLVANHSVFSPSLEVLPDPSLAMECPEEWPSVVAFIGPAGCGKSTAATYLQEEYGYSLLKFAHPIKEMLRVLGLEDRHLEGAEKEAPCDILGGVSPRRAMQTLGTEWGRTLIHPDIWVRAWMREAVWRLQNGRRLVIDDLRYPNELDAILRLGGSTLRIVRKDATQCEWHDSETQRLLCQRVIVNDGTREEFVKELARALDSLTPVTPPNPPTP